MKTLFNFQINPDNCRMHWEDIKVHSRSISTRITAVQLAKKVAKVFKAEVRLTEGEYPYTTSGAYFHHKEKYE